jgi:hypothetical protein
VEGVIVSLWLIMVGCFGVGMLGVFGHTIPRYVYIAKAVFGRVCFLTLVVCFLYLYSRCITTLHYILASSPTATRGHYESGGAGAHCT